MVDIADKGIGGLATRYAKALYALAAESNVLDETVGQMQAISCLIQEDEALAHLLAHPLVEAVKVGAALDEALAAQGVNDLIRRFISVVAMNRRLRDLHMLIEGFLSYAAALRGEVVAHVTTAFGLSDLQRTQLHARLAEAGYGAVRLAEQVDPAVLGGLRLQIGDKLFDTTLISRLNRLNYSLKGAA